MYVALSRVTSLNGLHLLGNYSSSTINVNTLAEKEYERLRVEKPFSPVEKPEFLDQNLTITLLNTRSLRKHAVDIANDNLMLENGSFNFILLFCIFISIFKREKRFAVL